MKPSTKPKAPATGAALPSFQQFVALALEKAESDLECICRIRCADEHWEDKDVDVDNAVDLALDQVRRMKSITFNHLSFDGEWYKVAAVLNLGAKAFSRKDCAYMRCLDSACHMFSQAGEMAEFVAPD